MKKTLEERFWEKVDKKGKGECWEWKAFCGNHGYGQIGFRGKMEQAHRISYELNVGKIPEGLCVLHHCDNTACVNPAHLFLGTQGDNMIDMSKKGRSMIGINQPRHKLNECEILEIRRLRSIGLKPKILSKMFGVSASHIWNIYNRLSWKHI